MLKELKDSCSQLAEENQELSNQLNRLKNELAEKSHMIAKIQSLLDIVDNDSKDVQELTYQMRDSITNIKQKFGNNEDILEDLDDLNKFAEQLQHEVMEIIIAQKQKYHKNRIRSNKSKQCSKENDQNALNLRRRNNKTNYKPQLLDNESVISQALSEDEDQSYEEPKRSPRRKKIKKPDVMIMDQANNLISEVFNF